MTDIKYISSITETSEEIIQALDEFCKGDEDEVMVEWALPTDANVIIQRAIEIQEDKSEPLFWGSEGQVN